MSVSEFVGSVAKIVGDDGVKGAIVLVALERPVDCLIQRCLGLSCYHPGKPSPFSHTFLISGSYNGQYTPILDCTIRDKNDRIAWKLPLIDSILAIINKRGRVYSAQLGDYDDHRVHPVGVKLIPELTNADRERIVTAGLDLQALGTHYDFLGLFRELIAMLLHIQLPADKDMFCSAFCQGAYRNGIGDKGDFLPGVDFHDVSPDDIWFSRTGANYPDTMPIPNSRDLCPGSILLGSGPLLD